MHSVGGRHCKHDFRVAGYIDLTPGPRTVRDVNAPQLNVVFRRDYDFCMRVVLAVAAPEFRAAFGENGLVGFRALERRLVRARPENATGDIPYVAEHAPGVASHILVPAGDRKIFPAAVTTAG